MIPDPRTIFFIETQLAGSSSLPQKAIKDMASGLILKEIHQDEVTLLQEKLSQLQRTMSSRGLSKDHDRQNMSPGYSQRPISGMSTKSARTLKKIPDTRPLSGNLRKSTGEAPIWDVPSQNEEMENIIKQKDSIIRRKDEEYYKLRKVLEDTQVDLQSVLDLNSQYLGIIGHYNQMQRVSVQTPKMMDKNDVMLELEQKLEDAETKIGELTNELSDISKELDSKQHKVDRLERKEQRYKEMLGISDDSDEKETELQIQQLIEAGEMAVYEIENIKKDLSKTKKEKKELQEKIDALTREKDKVEFHMRQQEMTMRKMKRQKMASHVIKEATDLLPNMSPEQSHIANQFKLPSIDRPGSQLALMSNMTSRGSHMYCMFCRQEFAPMKSQVTCRIHFRPIRNGKWTCCKDDSHRSAGCLQVPHFYVEITVDKKVFLTDGQRYMELT